MKHTATATFSQIPGTNPLHPKAWKVVVDGGWSSFLARCLPSMVKEGETEFSTDLTIEKKTKRKTYPQLRYLNGIVYPAFFAEYERLNGIRQPDEYVKRKLKMHEQVCFVQEVTDPITGLIEYEPKSCANAYIEEVVELIDRLLALAANIDLKIETPEEWCKRMGIFYRDWKMTGNLKKAREMIKELGQP